MNSTTSACSETRISASTSLPPIIIALRAEAETPDKAALAYRDFVRAAVRRSVLEFGAFRPEALADMAAAAGVPETDRAAVVRYIGRELTGLHEGNLIRYRLRAEDLRCLDRATLRS